MKDLIIIGAGPAGYTAGVYAQRNKMSSLLIGEREGGTMAQAHKICNFPVFEEISGVELSKKMRGVVESLGLEIEQGLVTEVQREDDHFLVSTKKGETEASNLLLATGSKRRRLGLDGEEEFIGKGVSYCATCDAPLFGGESVGVVGGANAATTAALMLSDIADKVYLIYRGDELKGEQMWIDQIHKTENIEIIYNTNVIGLEGENMLSGVELDNEKKIDMKGLFIEIGSVPRSSIYESLGVDLDKRGYIKVNEDQSTSVDGVWAAGDVTNGSNGFRQIVTAMSEASIAVNSMNQYE